jgi:hypothetical protein
MSGRVASPRAPPLRLSSLFGRMLVECPGAVAAYGKCVADQLDSVTRDACAREFAAMKACSETALAGLRAGRRG